MNDINNGQTNDAPRLRQHPTARFEGDEHLFDLNKISEQLKSEPHAATEGHRQIAFYHYGSVTMVLLEFDAGGEMEEHAANGVVSAHVLEGTVSFTTASGSHEIKGGQVLVLAPKVRHSVRASEASRMLLTVHLHGQKHDDSPRRVESP